MSCEFLLFHKKPSIVNTLLTYYLKVLIKIVKKIKNSEK